jgi:hypothetical protein
MVSVNQSALLVSLSVERLEDLVSILEMLLSLILQVVNLHRKEHQKILTSFSTLT